MEVIDKIQKEIFEKQTSQVIKDIKENGLHDQFYKLRIDITKLPVYDK